MPRIALYHWLPVASNMLLRLDFSGGTSIQEKLQEKLGHDKVSVDTSTHSLTYKTEFEFVENGTTTKLPVIGNFNQRGFNQCVLDLPMSSMSTAGIIGGALPKYSKFVTDLLYSVLPKAAQNNCAVLHEGIVGYDEFSSRPFDEATDVPAKKFLSTYRLTVITLGRDDFTSVRTGFNLHIEETHRNPTKQDSIDIEVPPFDPKAAPFDDPNGALAYVSKENNCVLFLSNAFSNAEDKFDVPRYKYSALIVFSTVVSRAIGILRNVRGHVPHLRRELSIALQHNTMLDEDFGPMVKISRYLSYVNLKLPVIQTTKNYLSLAAGSPEFTAKRKIFGEAAKHDFPEIEAVQDPELGVALVLRMLDENSKRLENLFAEEKDEIQVFSDEISRHLQITLASRDIQLSTRELEAAEMSRELERGGKNRANALKGLSIVLAANLGLQLAEILGLASMFGKVGVSSTIVKLAAFIGMPILAWLLIDFTIQQKSSHMRMVMEIKQRMSATSLDELVRKQRSKRMEIEGSRRLQTWKQAFELTRRNNKSSLKRNRKKRFDITIDYEANGLIHSIALETEYNHMLVDQVYVVQQVVDMLSKSGCIINDPKKVDTSLLGQILLDLGLQLDQHLPALNYVLAYQTGAILEMLQDFKREGFVEFLTDEEKHSWEDLILKPQEYLVWLKSIESDDPKFAELLGAENLRLKTRLLEDALPS